MTFDIGIITPRYPPSHAGGGEISVKLLADQLAERGVADITVYTFDGTATETSNGTVIKRLGTIPRYPYTLANGVAYRRLRHHIGGHDLLHAYNMLLHPAVGRLSTISGVPSVATLNGYPFVNSASIGIRPSRKRRVYEHTLLRGERPFLFGQMGGLDTLLPLSRAVKDVYERHGLQGASLEVIPNMIDPSLMITRSSSSDGISRLLFVGHLRDQKGVRFLIDAMEALPTECELTVVGDGPRREALERRRSANSAAERIRFLGHLPYDQVVQAYAAADVFVHPGTWPEPFGRTILEAMQAGLPVVTTDVGGPADVVTQPQLRCTPGDSGALASAIARAITDPDAIGRENMREVHARYHPDVVISQITDVYSQLTS